jgi:hypothetical protein
MDTVNSWPLSIIAYEEYRSLDISGDPVVIEALKIKLCLTDRFNLIRHTLIL